MRRAGGWLLGALVLAIMAAGAWLGLRPFLLREDATILFVRQAAMPAPSADAIASGLRMALEESLHRAGRFRVRLEEQSLPLGPLELSPFVLAEVSPDPESSSGRLPVVMAVATLPEGDGFRLLPDATRQGRAAADWAGRLGATCAMVVEENSNRRSALIAEAFRGRAGEIRLAVALSEIFPRPPEELARAASASGADLVFFGGENPPYWHGQWLFGALRTAGYAGRLMLADASPEVSYLDASGLFPEGTYLLSPLAPPPPGFDARYQAYAGKPPGPHVHTGYLAGRALLDALELTSRPDRDAVRWSLAQLSCFDVSGATTANHPAGYVMREGRFRFVESLK